MSAPAVEHADVWVATDDIPSLRLVTQTEEDSAAEFGSGEEGPWVDITFSTNGLSAFLERRLASLPEVVRVKVADRVSRSGTKAIHVWTMLSRDDRETRFKVYEIEQELVDHFPEMLFEFHSHLARDDAPDGDTVVYDPDV